MRAGFVSPLLGLLVFGSLVFPPSTLAGGDTGGDDVSRSYWNQDRGSGRGDGFVNVAPVRSEPKELWRASPGEIAAGPVVWGGEIFCVIARGRQFKLIGLDAKTGKSMGSVTLGKLTAPRIAVGQGLVAVCTEEFVRTYRVRGKTMRKNDTLKLGTFGIPCVAGSTLFVTDVAHRLHTIDLATGKDSGSIGRCSGRPSVRTRVVGLFDVGERSGYRGEYVHFRTLRRRSEKDRYAVGESDWGGMVRSSRKRASGGPPLVVPFGDNPDLEAWYVRPDHPLEVRSGSGPGMQAQLFSPYRTGMLSPIEVGPITWEDGILGFDPEGNLVFQDVKALFRTVLGRDARPEGARVGPITRAQGVAYAGNFALDLASGRVLWCLADLEFEGPLIPLADERILVRDSGGDLVCFGPSADGPSPVQADSTAPGLVPCPSDADGVVLADGRFLPGQVDESEGGAVVRPDGSGAITIDAAELALVVREGEAKLVGEQFPVQRAFLTGLESREAKLLEGCFEDYLRAHIGSECRRILVEYDRLGFARDRHDAMLERMAGRSENRASNRDKKVAKVRRSEDSGRAEIVAAYHESSSWCADHGMTRAATLLEHALLTFAPKAKLDYERIATWMPPTFPFRGDSDAGEAWLRWAPEIVPAGAEFLAPEDPRWRARWSGPEPTHTLALATKNLLLLTRSTDPEVVGLCLRTGEGAVRLLGDLFPAVDADPPRMEVRLHADRDAFLQEIRDGGNPAMEWAAGYFASDTRATTFYLPDFGSRSASLLELRKTLSHELTHQYLDLRASSGHARGDRAGIWATEGIARFFEEQAVELGLADRGLDNETVPAIDASASLLAQDKLLPLERLLPLDGRGFDRLHDDNSVEVHLRYTLGTRLYNERAIFYDESGALVFFLLHRAGKQAHEGMLAYLRAVYSGDLQPTTWQQFGFPSIPQLEEAFHAFLQDVGG